MRYTEISDAQAHSAEGQLLFCFSCAAMPFQLTGHHLKQAFARSAFLSQQVVHESTVGVSLVELAPDLSVILWTSLFPFTP